jgi:drug/metabolite transporter (DMT)-like permease
MRGLAPVLVALLGAMLLEERLTTAMWAGVALISVGILMPFWLWLGEGKVRLTGTSFALANALIIAVYTLVDGVGARLSGQPLSYCLWLSLLDGFPILTLALARHRGAVWAHLRRRWLPCTLGGLLSVGAYGIVLWAMTRAPIAAVAVLRETSVIFAAIMGAVILRERFGGARVAGAVLVVCGVATIRL